MLDTLWHLSVESLAMIVCKFGGSSVADASQIKKVKAILESDPERAIAVVSAPGKRDKEDVKITDLLYKCNSMAKEGFTCKPVFDIIAKRYIAIAEELGLKADALRAKLYEVRQSIDNGAGADYAASRGEYLSAYLISQVVGWEFLDTADVIVINNDNTVNPATYDNLANRLYPGRKYVVPGFYGRGENGTIKTFTRGGSDITGSILARAAKADLYENWTDVSGVLRADPRVVEYATSISELSYEACRELSDVGASVFHEEAIAPVYEVGIPINVKNTNRPEDAGTLIVPSPEKKELSGVSVRGGLTLVKLHKLLLFKKTGIRHALFTLLHVYGIRPSFSLFGIDSIVFLFDSAQATDETVKAMCDRFTKEFSLDAISSERGHAILGVGGSDIKGSAAVKAADALDDAGVAITFINYGASDASFLIGIKEEDSKKALKAVYDKLFK